VNEPTSPLNVMHVHDDYGPYLPETVSPDSSGLGYALLSICIRCEASYHPTHHQQQSEALSANVEMQARVRGDLTHDTQTSDNA
jgi:hypothetical protein